MTVQLGDHPRFPAPKGFQVAALEAARRRSEAPIRVIHPDPIFQVTLVPKRPVGLGWRQLSIGFPPEGVVDVVTQISFADGKVLWQRLPALERNHFVLHMRCDSPLEQIKFIVSGSGYLMRPTHVAFTKRLPLLLRLASRVPHLFRRDGLAAIKTIVRGPFRLAAALIEQRRDDRIAARRAARGDAIVIMVLRLLRAFSVQEMAYDKWIQVFDEAPRRDGLRHVERLQTLKHRPLFSILAISPTFDEFALERLTRSLAEQVYPQRELIVAAPAGLVDIIAEKISREIPETKNRPRLRPCANFRLARPFQFQTSIKQTSNSCESDVGSGRRSRVRR